MSVISANVFIIILILTLFYFFQKVTCKTRNIYDLIREQEKKESDTKKTASTTVTIICVVIVLLLAGCLVAFYLLYQRRRYKKLLERTDWNISIKDLIFHDSYQTDTQPKRDILIQDSGMDDSNRHSRLHIMGKFKSKVIGLRITPLPVQTTNVDLISRYLIKLKEEMLHYNVIEFYGITAIDQEWFSVNDSCTKGSINDLLVNKKLKLNDNALRSMAHDIARGMAFLHRHNIIHSCLRGSCCLVDSKWSVQIADWEFNGIYKETLTANENKHKQSFLVYAKQSYETVEGLFSEKMDFWTAPEILRLDYDYEPTTYCDMYSFGIVLQEIFSRNPPYIEHSGVINDQNLIKAIVNNGLRPQHVADVPTDIKKIMDLAWSDNPTNRLTFDLAVEIMKSEHTKQKETVIDAVLEALDNYSCGLEKKIEVLEDQINHPKKCLVFDDVASDRSSCSPQLYSQEHLKNLELQIYPDSIVICFSICQQNSNNDENVLFQNWTVCSEIINKLIHELDLESCCRVDQCFYGFSCIASTNNLTSSPISNHELLYLLSNLALKVTNTVKSKCRFSIQTKLHYGQALYGDTVYQNSGNSLLLQFGDTLRSAYDMTCIPHNQVVMTDNVLTELQPKYMCKVELIDVKNTDDNVNNSLENNYSKDSTNEKVTIIFNMNVSRKRIS